MAGRASVVLEHGWSGDRAGLSSQSTPSLVDERVVVERVDSAVGGSGKRGILSLKRPVQNGLVTNWDDMEKLWHHIFYNELRVAPEEHPVLLTEKPMTPKEQREKTIQVMFETFCVPAAYMANQACLSLYASGRGTGLVLDSGETETFAVPIYEGYSLPSSVVKTELGGGHVTQYMKQLLAEERSHHQQQQQFPAYHDEDIAVDVKEQLCYIPLDLSEELQSTMDEVAEYELPDGQVLRVGDCRIRAPECLFHPREHGVEAKGLQDVVNESVRKSDIDLRRDLMCNVILSGGNTLFPGIKERLKSELTKNNRMTVNVVAADHRKYNVWIGGSILASLSTFQQMWISKEEYDESGPNVAGRKFF